MKTLGLTVLLFGFQAFAGPGDMSSDIFNPNNSMNYFNPMSPYSAKEQEAFDEKAYQEQLNKLLIPYGLKTQDHIVFRLQNLDMNLIRQNTHTLWGDPYVQFELQGCFSFCFGSQGRGLVRDLPYNYSLADFARFMEGMSSKEPVTLRMRLVHHGIFNDNYGEFRIDLKQLSQLKHIEFSNAYYMMSVDLVSSN